MPDEIREIWPSGIVGCECILKNDESGTESAQRRPASHTHQTTNDSLIFCWGQYTRVLALVLCKLPSSPHDTHCRISVTAYGCIANVWVGFARPVPAVPVMIEIPSYKRISILHPEVIFRAFVRCSPLWSGSGGCTAGGVFCAGLGSRVLAVQTSPCLIVSRNSPERRSAIHCRRIER